MTEVLVDTDVFIDHLRGARPLQAGDQSISYSVVTRCELYASSNVDEVVLQTLLAPFAEIPVNRTIAERAGRVRRETGTRITYALIAATALEHGLNLMTRNIRDFERVPGLHLHSTT